MSQKDRNNKLKWEATAEYLLALSKKQNISLQFVATAYNISSSTLSYALARLLYPNANNVTSVSTEGARIFKQLANDGELTPMYIKKLYNRCNIPIPAILRDAVNKEGNNNNVQIEPTPKKDTKPTQDCVNCGTTLMPQARFCHSCGHPVLISKQKALNICDCMAEAIKVQFVKQHQTTYLSALERIKNYIEHTEE